MSSKRVVPRELLDRTARPLLVRLLEPYAAFFAERGVSLSDLAATSQDDRRLVRRAHDVLCDDPAAIPSDLAATLALFEALANRSGQASLFELCPALTRVRLGHQDTAATAILDHPEATLRAKRVIDGGGGLLFSDFEAASHQAPTLSQDALDALVAAFRRWLVAHGRTALCNLHVSHRTTEHHLEIEHGRAPATDDVVGEALDLTQMTVVRAERAVVVVDARAGRMSVHAAHAAIKDLLRRLIGEHLFGDAHHFRRTGVYSLLPLAKGLDEALACDDVPGVKSATLLAMTLTTGDERITREIVGRGDLRKTRRARELYEALAEGAVVEWCKLRFELEGRARPVVVELSPARKQLPRASADVENLVDEWLVARGYIVLAEHRRRAARQAESG